MAGSNYDVNIKLDVRKINQQISNLERRISKLNALAQGKRGDSKILLKNERDKTAQLLRQERTQKKINRELEKTNKLKKDNLKLTQQETRTGKPTRKTSTGGRPSSKIPLGASSPLNFSPMGQMLPGRGSTGGSGVLSGALISGAFPLLFGQGPLGAAAGFGGGLIGGKLGGQTGGFAGGLVATALLTQAQQVFDATSKLGQAFSSLTPDVEGLTTALGAAGTERERQIQLIKKTEGTQAALAAVTEQMNKAIGTDSVDKLKEFGELSRLIGNQFKLMATKMYVALLPLLNLLSTPFAGPAQREETKRLAEVGGSATDPALLALQQELANVGPGRGRSGVKKANERKAELQAQIDARMEELALVGKTLERQTTINMIEDSRLKKVRQQNALLQAKIDGNYEEVLLAQELDAKIKEMIEDGATLEELDVNKIENLLKQNNLLEKQAQQAEMVRQQFKSLGQSLATDVADGLQGLIRGTSTLGDMLNNVLNKLIDAAFNMALFGNPGGQLGGGGLFGSILGGLGGMFGGGGGFKAPAPMKPGFMGTGIPSVLPAGSFGITGKLANGGYAKGGKSYLVGERGPELFTPGATGGQISPMGSTNIVVNVDASGSSVEGDESAGRELGRLISAAVQSEIIQQKRPGGILA